MLDLPFEASPVITFTLLLSNTSDAINLHHGFITC